MGWSANSQFQYTGGNPRVADREEPDHEHEEEKGCMIFYYTNRAKWLKAAVLGTYDGLLSTASLMMGVGAVRRDAKTMVLTAFASLVAGACSMAIGEFVTVYAQYDLEVGQINRESDWGAKELDAEKLPNPWQAAGVSALAFVVGAMFHLLGATFVKDYGVRVGVVSIALLGFGGLGAVLGKAPAVKSSLRALVEGWLAMGVTFGLTKLLGSKGF